jgi:hypothetical protein
MLWQAIRTLGIWILFLPCSGLALGAPHNSRLSPSSGTVGATVTLTSQGTSTARFQSPTITSLLPDTGPVGHQVDIEGTNFGANQGASTVHFGGTTATATSWSDTEIVVPVPSNAATGDVTVTVSGLTSNPVTFTVGPVALQIASPASGTIVSPGQSLSVSVTSPSNTSFTDVVIVGESPLPLVNEAMSVPAEFTLDIPLNIASRKYAISAMGLTVSDQNVESDAIWIDIERPDMPASIAAATNSLEFIATGQELPINLLGTFANGSELYITESSHVTYASSDTKIVTVASDGIVTAGAPGYAVVTATYTNNGRAIRGFIGITVASSVPTPSIYSLSFGDQTLGTSGIAQHLTLTNNSIWPVQITNVSVSRDYSVTSDCTDSSPLLPGGTCSVSILFTPRTVGLRTGKLSIGSSFSAIPISIPLVGTGQ